MEQDIIELQMRVDALTQQVALFASVDADLATKMLGFWIIEFIMAHAAGRVVRWFSKV